MAVHADRARRGLPLVPDEVVVGAECRCRTNSQWDDDCQRHMGTPPDTYTVRYRWYFANGYGAEVRPNGAFVNTDVNSEHVRATWHPEVGQYHTFSVIERYTREQPHRFGPEKRWSRAFNIGEVTLGTTEAVPSPEAQIVQDRLLWVMGFHDNDAVGRGGERQNPGDDELRRRERAAARGDATAFPPLWAARMRAGLCQTCGVTPTTPELYTHGGREGPTHTAVCGRCRVAGEEVGSAITTDEWQLRGWRALEEHTNPGDEGRRARERLARIEAELGGAGADVARLRDAQRSGKLSPVAIEWAAVLGDPAAAAVAHHQHLAGWMPATARDSLAARMESIVLWHAQHGYRDLWPAIDATINRSWRRAVEAHPAWAGTHAAGDVMRDSLSGSRMAALRGLRHAFANHAGLQYYMQYRAYDEESDRQRLDFIALLLERPLP